jgi:hypothetical protein
MDSARLKGVVMTCVNKLGRSRRPRVHALLTRRPRMLALLALLAIVGLAAVPASATAQSGKAMVRVAHFSPDAPAVDVYVNGTKTLSGVSFGTVSEYLEVPADTYTFEVRPANAPASSKPVIKATATVQGGQAFTVAAVGALASIRGRIYSDDLSAPPPGQGKVRVIHAAVGVPAVDVAVRGGPTLFRGVRFPDATPYVAVPAGTFDIQVRAAATGKTLLSASDLAVRAGTISTVAAIGGAGKPPRLLPIVDAAGLARAPEGGVPTGAGGTAPAAPHGPPVVPTTAAVAGLVALLALLGTRRRGAGRAG